MMMHALFFTPSPQALQPHARHRNRPRASSSLQRKMPWRNNEAHQVLVLQQESASIISSEKMLIFFWRNNEALLLLSFLQEPHYFFRKKCLFFSEEIMRPASCSSARQCFIISSNRIILFFSKQWDAQATAQATVYYFKVQAPSYILTKKRLFFHPLFLSSDENADFCQEK